MFFNDERNVRKIVELKYSVKADNFSIAVPQQEVIRRSGLPTLWVLTLPKAVPGLGRVLVTQSAISSVI